MLSFWEKQAMLDYDLIIVGAGITGLSTAISRKALYPEERILILERGLLPSGASTKNAGFACIGSLTELLDDLQHMPPEEMCSLVTLRKKGLEMLIARLGEEAIDYQENGSYELISEAELPALGQIDRLNALLKKVLGGSAYTLANNKISEFGFPPSKVKAIIRNNFEGQLHTGKMMRRLTELALQKGVAIKNGANVLNWQQTDEQVEIVVDNPFDKSRIIFTAKKLAICNNAFAKAILPDIDLKPGRGQVMVTAPLEKLPFKGIFHFDKGYYYFRNIGKRILIGGGRNLDFQGEQTTDFAYNEQIQEELEKQLRELVLPNTSFQIEQRWAGIMGFGPTRQPYIKAVSDNVFAAVGLGGMGVAIGSAIGEELAKMMDSNYFHKINDYYGRHG